MSPTFQPILYHWSLSIPPENIYRGFRNVAKCIDVFKGIKRDHWHEMG